MLTSQRGLVKLVASAATAVIATSCDRTAKLPRTETASAVGRTLASADSIARPATSGWNENAGPLLLVAGEQPEVAIVVLPHFQGEQAAVDIEFDIAAIRGTPVTLINRGGFIGSATLGARATAGEDDDCVGWPTLRVITSSGVVPSWTIGLVRPRVVPIALDSIEALAPTDSARLVAEIIQLVSTIPADVAGSRLSGLPFSVEDVRRFRVSGTADALIAHTVRRIHQEANPLEERTFLIVEHDRLGPDSSSRPSSSGQYRLVFHQRATGREETLEGTEVLAALMPRDTPRPLLVLAREYEGGVRYLLLERSQSGSWRPQWTSALVRC